MMSGGPPTHGVESSPRRLAIQLAAVAATVAVLASCGGSSGNKSSSGSDLPAITLSSGNQKVTSSAVSYLKDGTVHQASPTLASLPVQPGATVTITTPQEVADRGWQLQLDNKIIIQRRMSTTGTMTVPTNLAGRQPLVTILAAPVGESDRASGLWVYRLSPTAS
jgi:hypothetical protein